MVITLFNGKEIDISGLTINQLWELHYEQEKAFADLIKKAKPFSPERAALMKKGYETIHKIMIVRSNKAGKEKDSYGAKDLYIKLAEKIVKKIITQKGKCLFFEAGVGTGKILNHIASLENVTAIGCDVFIDKKIINSGLLVHECTIHEALLKLDNNSINVFYWNDVMEHIPEDEIEEYIKVLSQKMDTDGIIITITPNRLKGPCDITAHFEPHGTVAKGFHFHEYTFDEILTIFQKYGIKSEYGFFGYAGKGWYILSSPKYIDRIKLLIEKKVKNLPYKIKKILLVIMGCDTSILKKDKILNI
ncbi:MAG: hypothetical protein FWE72_01165 [Spirochaetaceae bacterium]|nr:hypothetical protein [Spirochaetaceae bacterium]